MTTNNMNNRALLMVVDSYQPSLESFSSALKAFGFSVLTANTAQHAVELNRQEKPDLVILDMHLPNLSSIDLANELLESGSPFIFLCNHEKFMSIGKHDEQGSLAILEKPKDLSTLLPAVESALAWSQEIRRLKETEQRYLKALETGKVVDAVVGILMERHHLDRDNAYEMLRGKARSQRRKLVELAQEILDTHGKLNQMTS